MHKTFVSITLALVFLLSGYGVTRLAAAPPPPLFDELGHLSHTVTTGSPLAQRYFNQGLRLTWGFNHDEALAAYEEAARIDPACAMCEWGTAYVLGPNINLPMDPAAEPRAHAAIQRALAHIDRVSPLERLLIRALATRYGPETDDDGIYRAARDAAYAEAMRQVAARYPNDADVQSLFADALMNLSPWHYWGPEGEPLAHTEDQVAAVQKALAANPDHPGACHLWIHTMEASSHPERALSCADRLPALMPGAGHLVHMPAHIYMRLGMYDRAVKNNEQAVAVDARYMTRRPRKPGAESFYRQLYIPHNDHFMWFAAVQQGDRDKALSAARGLARRMPVEMVRAKPSLEFFTPTRLYTLVRFGMWQQVLAEPAPPADLTYSTGMWHHARGLALTANGDPAGARVELARLLSITDATDAGRIISLNPARTLLEIAGATLRGKIAAAEGRTDDARVAFTEGIRLEDSLLDDEPHPWYHPVRQHLAGTLLNAGHAAEAATAFRADLGRHPENVWSLHGLARSLKVLGDPEAERVKARFRTQWRGANLPL
ncbi:MAG: hypothetical protein ACE5FN_02950 [Leptospirillia bacterium]